MSTYLHAWRAVLAAALVCSLWGCGQDATAKPQERELAMAKVNIAEVEIRPFRETLELPGRIAASKTAEVRARVAGIVISRDFKEGSLVEKGQTLFHIDPAPYEAALAQAKADLAKAEASMSDLKSTADRYAKLIRTGAISPQDFETAGNNYKAAEAARDACLAAVKTASLNLGYAVVTAPISGRIGRALVTEGALVGEGEATHLATIQQLDPVYADINQPVAEYLSLRTAMNEALRGEREANVTVRLEDAGVKAKGRLLFSDAAVDQDTGQVSLRCEFDNPERLFLPGMYVRIRISLGDEQTAIYVPQRAVLRDADGSARVYVVGDDNTAQVRPVKTGRMEGGLWRILDGLEPHERIVVDGAAKAKPGMVVSARVGTPAGAARLAAGN